MSNDKSTNKDDEWWKCAKTHSSFLHTLLRLIIITYTNDGREVEYTQQLFLHLLVSQHHIVSHHHRESLFAFVNKHESANNNVMHCYFHTQPCKTSSCNYLTKHRSSNQVASFFQESNCKKNIYELLNKKFKEKKTKKKGETCSTHRTHPTWGSKGSNIT